MTWETKVEIAVNKCEEGGKTKVDGRCVNCEGRMVVYYIDS